MYIRRLCRHENREFVISDRYLFIVCFAQMSSVGSLDKQDKSSTTKNIIFIVLDYKICNINVSSCNGILCQ